MRLIYGVVISILTLVVYHLLPEQWRDYIALGVIVYICAIIRYEIRQLFKVIRIYFYKEDIDKNENL
jgi:hypothetical protein